MGIPKFYRWTSERYPCLSEIIKEYQIPEFDNLYLDMNGIIHNCSHPNDEDVHLRISERQIFKDIFHYIEFLFKMIKPCKVFFMAIDGVAPRAKMNQQRGRRFRSARIAEEQEAEAINKGEVLPSEERFDSNCITPGTEFMARLQEQLKYFVQVKITTDPLWQREGLVIYLSGHDVPGEGEHKIMDFIRHIRSKPDYDPMTRHCLYGLDADLVMLGLSTHELQFSLLREEVKFTRAKKPKKGLKRPPKQNQGTANYDLTNVSIFKCDNSSGGPNDCILRPPQQPQLSAYSSEVKEGMSFSQALETVIAVSTSTEAKEVATQEEKPKDTNGTPPPPVANDAGATGAYKAPLPEKTTFLLLHLSLMRDYIDFEFQELKETLEKSGGPVKYDLENLIDDWILMNILVGNDFVPHLPHLHIVKGALPMLYRNYMEVLPTLDGYLNENGILNLRRFEVFIKKLSKFDIELFRETYDDMKYMESKTGKNIVLGEKMFELEGFDFDDSGVANFEEEELEPLSPELKALAQRTEAEVFGEKKTEGGGKLCAELFREDDDYFDKEDSEELKLEFLQHKRNYYISKLHENEISSEFIEMYCREYIRAIQWVLLYYYKGVSSWGWFYPFHYAPFASDLKNFTDYTIEFDKGQPFRPFEQLLAVLPSQSRKLLPKCYQWLMTEKQSPIVEFYPEKFEQDLNGKKADWEAVVLIPFIDEGKLLTVMEKEVLNLTSEESYRNSRGTMMCYSYTKKDNGPIVSPQDLFPTLPSSHADIVKINEVTYDPNLLPKGLHPQAKRTTIYQGFPTLKSKPVKCVIEKAEIKVFEFVTREESMILSLEDVSDKCSDIWSLASKLIGKSVWANWPHLTFAYVTGILTREGKIIEDCGRILKDPRFEESRAEKEFNTISKALMTRHLKCKGIKLGSLNVILYAKMMEGRKVRCDSKGNVDFQTQWSALEQPFALKTCVYEENVTEIFYLDRTLAKSYLDMYRNGDQVFYLGDKLFGTLGTVTGHDEAKSSVVVSFEVPSRGSDEFNLKNLLGHQELKSHDYFNSYTAAGKCQLSSYVLSRITGTVFISVEKEKKSKKLGRSSNRRKQQPLGAGNLESSSWSDSSSDEDFPALEMKKVNVGLDLKFNKKNLEVRGYTSKRDGQWFYSGKAIQLVNDYVERFHDFIQALTRYEKGVDVYNAADLFESDAMARVNEMVEWLEQRGVRELTRIPTNTKLLDDDDIDAVWKYVLRNKASTKKPTIKKWSVRPNLLLKPGLDRGCVTPVPNSRFDMLDRVICVDRGAPVQVGHRGTVVGIQTPVATEPEQIEESFKSTGAATLMTLIVLVDPTPGTFDKAEDYGATDSSVEKLSNSLATMLGVSKETAIVPMNGTSGITIPQDQMMSMKPRLIKLYPYQVINLSQGPSLLRESHKISKQVNRMNVGNGFLPITRENEAQLSKNISRKTLPDTNRHVRILTRPANASTSNALVSNQQGKKNPFVTYNSQAVHESRKPSNQQQPTPLMQILQPLNKPANASTQNSTEKVTWPPQPVKLTPVEQFFSAAALAQQTASGSQVIDKGAAYDSTLNRGNDKRPKKKDSPQKQSVDKTQQNAALTASLEKMLSSSSSKQPNQNQTSPKKAQQKDTLQQQKPVSQGTQDLVQLLNQGFQQYESRGKSKRVGGGQQQQRDKTSGSFTVYNNSSGQPPAFRRDTQALERDSTPVTVGVGPFGGLPPNLPNIPAQWLPGHQQRQQVTQQQRPQMTHQHQHRPLKQHHQQHYQHQQVYHSQQYRPLPMYHGDSRGFHFPPDMNNAFVYPGNGQFHRQAPPASFAPTSFVPTQVSRKQAQGQGKSPAASREQESHQQQQQRPILIEAQQNPSESTVTSSGIMSNPDFKSPCADNEPRKSRIAANFGMSP